MSYVLLATNWNGWHINTWNAAVSRSQIHTHTHGFNWFAILYIYSNSFLRSLCAPLTFESQFGHSCRAEVQRRKFYDVGDNHLKHSSFSFRICHEYRCVFWRDRHRSCRRYYHFNSIVSIKYVHIKYCLSFRFFPCDFFPDFVYLTASSRHTEMFQFSLYSGICSCALSATANVSHTICKLHRLSVVADVGPVIHRSLT